MSDKLTLNVESDFGIGKRLFLVLLAFVMYYVVGYFYSSNGMIYGDNLFYTILWSELLLFIPKAVIALSSFRISGMKTTDEMDLRVVESLVGFGTVLFLFILTIGILFVTWHVVAGMTLSAVGLYGYRFVAGACIDYTRRIFDSK